MTTGSIAAWLTFVCVQDLPIREESLQLARATEIGGIHRVKRRIVVDHRNHTNEKSTLPKAAANLREQWTMQVIAIANQVVGIRRNLKIRRFKVSKARIDSAGK